MNINYIPYTFGSPCEIQFNFGLYTPNHTSLIAEETFSSGIENLSKHLEGKIYCLFFSR